MVNPADIIASMNNGDNDTKVPMQLANVLGTLKQVTPEGQVNNPNGEKAADAAPANLKKAPNTAEEIEAFHNDPNVMKRAATVGDVLNTGFNLQANGEDADFVRHGDTVNFADGTGTTVEFVPSEDGKTNTIKINTVMAYTDENGNKVAKADDGKYYPVDPATGEPDKTKPAVENPQVNVVNADGTTTKPTVLGNVAAGAKTYGPNLAQPTNETEEAKNIAKNVSDAYEGLADLNSSTPTNVMTVADAKNMGWVVSTLHGNGYADDVRNANHVDFVGTGLATVKGHTDEATGIRVITVDVNAQNVVQDAQLPVVYTNKDGDKVVKVGDKFYKQDDIIAVDGKVYPKDSVVAADGQVYPEGTTLNDQGLPTDSNVAAIQPLPENSDKVVAPADIIASMNNGDNSTAEPMTLANVMGTLKQVTPEGQVNNPNGEKAADAAPENLKKAPNTAEEIEGFHKDPDVLNRAATVGDVLNTGFNLQANGEDADFVRHGDTVNFVNGKGTVASVETNPEGTATNVTFNIDAGEINATDKGDVTGPVKAAEEALKAAQDALAQDPDNQDLKDAVKKAEGDLAKAGDQVATAQNVADAINNSGWNIVGKGEPDEDGNRKDVTTKVKPGSQVSFQDGKGTKAITDVDSEGNPFVRIDIDADKVAENISKGDINVVNEGDNAGTVAPKAGDENKLVTAQEVADAINGSGWTAAIGRDNTDFADQAGADQPQLINPGETVKFQSGKNLKVKQDGNNITYALADDVEINTAQVGGPGKDGQPGKDGSVNVKAADGQSGVAINGKDASVTAGGDNGASVAINGKDGSIGLQGPRGDNGKDGLGATIKVGQGPAGIHGDDGFAGLNGEKPRLVYTPIDPATGRPALDKDGKPVEEKVATLNDGLAFAGDDPAVKVKRKLGETLNIKGGANKDRLTDNNIGVVADPATGALNVKLAKDVNLGDDGSLAVGGVTINQDGINAGGKQIKNVAPGTAPTDAVNVSQLRDATIDVHNKINRNNKDLRAGIAGANAAAGLPQVYIPGKSMVAASAGTFKGQSAVAVGYSRASDNGKLILKLQGNANTRGDFGGSVGVGYQW
ncbi:MAG: YadA-like family protein [Pasteurellaceae bacterium]|nr:YadA-like family protein [Pasteurellaceae bacterium]